MVEREDRLARFALREKPLYIENDAILRSYAVALTSLEEAQKKSDHLTLVAPCDGKVASVDVSEGDEVTAGTLLISLVEDAGMEIILTVDELDIPLVEKGQKVTMTVDALSGLTITGEVLKIAPLGNTETSVTTYDVYILAEDIDERVLGGMNVSGEILVGGAEDAVLIPTDAVRKDENGYFVMLEGGEIRRIETGIMTVESTQVLSGLEAGEAIAY
ncbi:MAG: efflux RND transporter periplasmic adaptor subunit [Clostridia bacterium]|nr:efflux RND transporter periplasmic adaptor subunit [Clostridia bacterium]